MPNEESKSIRNVFIGIMISGLVIFLIGGALSVKMLIIDRMNKLSTQGTIVDISSNATTVKYKVKHKEYTRKYSVYSSTFYNGKKVKIYYNKLNPYKSSIANLAYLILIVPGVGILLMGISGVGFMYIYTKYYRKYM